jgi:hypothetical protein
MASPCEPKLCDYRVSPLQPCNEPVEPGTDYCAAHALDATCPYCGRPGDGTPCAPYCGAPGGRASSRERGGLMRFRVFCTKVLASGDHRTVCESHRSLAEALAAMREHQQRPWQRVMVSSVLPARPVPQQLLLAGWLAVPSTDAVRRR